LCSEKELLRFYYLKSKRLIWQIKMEQHINRNRELAGILEQMANLHKFDRMRNRAYRKASTAIKNANLIVVSGDYAKKNIDGVGASSAKCIDEYLRTGSVAALANQDVTEKNKIEIVQLFQTIHGVGEVTAINWYNAGHRTLNDLYPLYNNMAMTADQKIGYLYYRDFLLKIPRSEIDMVERNIKILWSNLNGGVKIEFCIAGSYRRGELESGDVDILVKLPNNVNIAMDDLLAPLVQVGLIVQHITKTSDFKYMGVYKYKMDSTKDDENIHARRIDIRLINESSWPFALLYFTGSQHFNIMMRQHAINIGYSLNEYSLTSTTEQSRPIPECKTELDIFNALNLIYVRPEDRLRRPHALEMSSVTRPNTPPSPQIQMFQTAPSVSLMVHRINDLGLSNKSHKIASFDLDSTLIEYMGGNPFCKDLSKMIIMKGRKAKLDKLVLEGYTIVIFSNQKCVKVEDRTSKVAKLEHALKLLDVPCILFGAHENDQYRKPNPGMWNLLMNFFGSIEVSESYYIGDAAGRIGDFASSDKDFANTINLPFGVPEDFFM
tara:strand:+ start:95848 stop:97497 length:1650 start_codon:yes stop_codon:yes gene_type:complete